MRMVNVKKRTGAFQPFDQNKLRNSLMKAGAREENARKVSDAIATKVKDAIETTEIKRLAANELRPLNQEAAMKYETFHPTMPAK